MTLVPLAYETIPHWRPLAFFSEFRPDRSVAAIAAPAFMFNFGHWDLIPIQLCAMLSVLVLGIYAAAAAKRRNHSEAWMFGGLGLAVMMGQAILLALGPDASTMPDSTEFQELFIAIALAWYSWRVLRRPLSA